jgi:hypothetical protein
MKTIPIFVSHDAEAAPNGYHPEDLNTYENE